MSMQNFKFYEVEEIEMPSHAGWGAAGFATGLGLAAIAIGVGLAIT